MGRRLRVFSLVLRMNLMQVSEEVLVNPSLTRWVTMRGVFGKLCVAPV